MALLIKPEHGTFDEVETIEPESGHSWFDLDELQKHVGGWIEMVRPAISKNPQFAIDGTISIGKPVYTMMIVDEEGIRKQLPLNNVASMLHGSPILGNALLLEHFEID